MSFLTNNSKFCLSKGKLVFSSSAPTPTIASVKIVGTGSMMEKYVEYKGEKYYTNNDTFNVTIGDNLYFFILADFEEYGVITINGTTVAEEQFSADYTWKIPSGIKSVQINLSSNNLIAITTSN